MGQRYHVPLLPPWLFTSPPRSTLRAFLRSLYVGLLACPPWLGANSFATCSTCYNYDTPKSLVELFPYLFHVMVGTPVPRCAFDASLLPLGVA